ncbi:MAG: hypothetical protein ACLS3F_01770 [Oscillospiraceae bacterium]
MKKRVLSLLMALTLCLTTLPTAVFADVTENGEGSGGTHYVAESGGTQYETVQEILENMEEGEITLLDSVTEDLTVYAATTIHMNGHSITGNIDAMDSLTLNGGTVDGTVKVDGGTLNMTAPAEAEAAITGGLNVVSGSASVSGAKVGVKGTLYFDGKDMLISGAVKAVELDSVAEPAAKTLYGSATVNGDTAAEAGFDTDTYKVGGEIAKKLTNKPVGSTTPAAPSLTLTETSKSLTAGKTAVFTANYTGTDTLNAYVQGSAVNGCFTISQKNNGDGTYTVSVKIDEETPGGTYTLFVHEVGNTSVQASATITVIGLPDAAEVNGKQYKSLPRALNAARDGDTVKLLANHVTDADALNALGEDFTFEQYASIVPVVTKTLTLDLNHKTVDYLEVGFSETNEETQKKETLATGNLTVTGEAAYGRISNLMFMAGALDIRSGEIGGSGCAGLFCDANSGSVTVSNGTVYGLTVFEGASVTVNGGSKHAGEWVVASGAALNITDGTFGDVQFTRNGTIAISGGTFQSIKSNIAEVLQPLMSLLDTQKVYAFYKGDDVQDGNATELADVTVREHTHTMVDNKCACGFSCTHTNTEGASTIDKDGKCAVCGTQFAAVIGETYYTDVPSALDAAADGQTITLLANGTLPYGIYASKTLTLDLNGHSLSGHSLNVGGSTATGQALTGNLTVIDSSGGNGAVGVTVRDGGTLVFDPENDSTTLLQLEVWGGKVELHRGKILRKDLRLNNSITLGDLLPRNAGLAYYCGDTQLTLKEAASKTCDLVVKSCAHGGKNGFDETATACPYCNAPAVAETALNNGEGSRLLRRFANLQTAIDADRDGGATLQLLADVTGNYTIDGTRDTGLDLNGHSIKGTVTVKAAAGSNTTTFSNTQNTTTASVDAVVAHRGAKLAGSKYPAVIGTLTLAGGATWKNILNDTALGYKVLNADGTHKWYARDDVKGSQLNNVIIDRLPITSKTLYLKVGGKNLTGNSPKVERGTTVQLCASCNAKDVTVEFSILKKGETTPITLDESRAMNRWAQYKKMYSFANDNRRTTTIYFTATKDGYSVTSSHKQLTVTKAAIPASAITAPAANALTYNGSEQLLVTEGSVDAKYGEMQYRLGTSGGFSTATPTAADAGTYTVYYKVVGAEGYNDTAAKSIKVTIGPVKIKGICNVASVSKTYDGSASVTLPKANLAFLDAAGNMISLPESAYTITDARFTTRQDDFTYEDSPDAGTKETISFTLTLTDSNYVFEGEAANVRSDNFNFTSDDDRFKIDQATVTPAEITLFVYNDVAKTYTLDLATLLPELTSGCDYGKIKYQGCDYHFTDSTYLDSNNGMFVSNEGILTLPIVAAHSAEVNKQIGTITAPVVTANYQQFELTIKVVIGEKITPVTSDDFKISATGITYRQTLENSTLAVEGTMKDPTTGKEVPGTFAWLNKYDRPINTGDVYFDWTFTPAEGYEEYAAVTDSVKVPVAPKSIEGAAITLEATSLEYNAAEQSPKITGVMLEDWDETRITYIIKSGDKATDVSDSITLTIEGTGNYTGTATVEWKITPKTVTPTMKVASCTYTGDALDPAVTLEDGDAVIPEGEYTAEYSNNTNAGTGRVTIKDVEGGNYIIASISRDFPIDQAAAPTNIQHGTLNVINGTQRTYTYDFQQLLPAAPHGDYGTVRYDLGNRQTAINFTAHGYYIDPEIAEFEGSKLTLVGLYAKDGTATGQIGTVEVKVTTTNYKDFKLTLVLNAVDRITPVADGSITASKITYGQTLSESRISGTMKDPTTDAAVEGTFAWQLPDDTILDASTLGHDIGWKFTPKDGNAYTEATGTATVKVDKAQQYGKVSMKFYIYGETPSTPSLTDRTGDGSVTYYYNTTNSNSGGTEWKNIQPDTLSAGTRYYMYAELGETENYESFTTDCVKFWVMKAIPTCTKPTGLTAKYGQKLSQIALPNPEGNTPGTWRWQEPETVLDQLGTRSFYADFKPDNETYSEVLNVAIDVTVGPADGGSLKTVELAQKYTDTSEHTYKPDWSGLPGGQTWRYNSEYSVSTGSNVALTKQDFEADGSLLTYAISGGKAGDKITITLKASCDNYKDFTITLNITLTEKDDQKALTITGNTSVIYGEKLTLTTSGGNGTGAVTYRIDTAHSTGEAAIDPNTGVLTPVRVGSVSVIAAKAGDNDYNDVTSAPFVLMIKPATPTGEPNYTKITTGGKTLKDAALTTKGSTLNPNDGKLEWLDDKGNALPDDTRVKANMTYKWRFTPTDTNYTTLTGEIELLYHKSNGGGSSGYSYYTIEATAGAGGSISPSGSVSVREGGDQTFTITPDKGYAVSTVKIDGKSIGAVKSYTFENVSRTHTIEVVFVKGTASARTGDSSDLPLWSALLLASTLTLAGAVHYKRKRAR